MTPKGVYPTTATHQLSTNSSFSSFSILANVLESVKRVYYAFFDKKISILITKFDPKGVYLTTAKHNFSIFSSFLGF